MDQTMPLRMKEAREAMGISQEKLAQIVGCSYVTINRIENGRSETSLDLTTRIAKTLAVSLDWLVHGSGQGPKAKRIQTSPMDAT